MEFPDIGKQCSVSTCNKLDFLPIKCDSCSDTFCEEHYSYVRHNCRSAYKKDNQVPVCPLCGTPVPVPLGQEPNMVVGVHIDNDCQSDPARSKRRIFTNRCSLKGCKVKEVIPVVCNECTLNYCLKHRHPQDHHCGGKKAAMRSKAFNAAVARTQPKTSVNISEDEALARALALSMQDTPKSQEERDLELARQLQASEYNSTTAPTRSNPRDRCSIT